MIIKQIKTLTYYYQDIDYFDIHHVSKVDKVSGTTYLFLLQNKLIKVKSKSNIVTYIIKMKSQYDEMIFTYKVKDKKAFALGVLQCLEDINTKNIINLIK